MVAIKKNWVYDYFLRIWSDTKTDLIKKHRDLKLGEHAPLEHISNFFVFWSDMEGSKLWKTVALREFSGTFKGFMIA